LQIDFLDKQKVYTVQKNLLTYNLKNDAPDMTTVFTDAMTASAADYDFTKVDEVAVVLPDSLPVVDIGPNYGFRATVGNATITRGFDLTYINPNNKRVIDDGWLTHELGHTLGLTHPFQYPTPTSVDRWPYAWDVMQYDNTAAPDLTTWEKYILGWIDDSQLDCLAAPLNQNITAYLESNGTPDSAIKMLIYRLSDTQAIVVESRRKSGNDPLTGTEEGVLVYKLDLNKGFGLGDIKLLYKNAQPVNTKYGTEMFGSLHEGDSVVSDGVAIKVIKHASGGDFVSISKV
jgi:M6 family metalloprotease-like protein